MVQNEREKPINPGHLPGAPPCPIRDISQAKIREWIARDEAELTALAAKRQ